jgi:ubiquinone/menaquinone biosynthesis C-methylase UbiE
MATKKPDYGLDAPGVVRNLALVALAGFLTFATALAGLWSGVLFGISFASIGLGCMFTFGFTALAMIYSSRVGKVRGREKFLDLVPWRGDEQVLDVGCGRGLLLIGAAKRLTTGKVTGIDIWQTQDLSGNRPDATLENASLEGVADRVEVKTADMRELPFENGTFDTIVSSWAVHNLSRAADREKSLREIARVLKPCGRVLLRDIKNGAEYTRALTAAGLKVRRADDRLASFLIMLWTFTGLKPVILIGEKPTGGLR